MNKRSRIVVILVNYNGIKDTVECVNSIEQSTFPVDVIVVDNASENDDVEILSKDFPNIKVIKSTTNLGFAGGNNLGIKYAFKQGYEYITLLNNDTVIDKDMFMELYNFARKDLVTLPEMYYYDWPEKIWYSGGVVDKKTGIVKHIIEPVSEKDTTRACRFATGCCMMIHRNIIENVGMLEDRFFMYCEDEEYSLRLAKNNINIAVIPKAKLWHKVAQSSKKDSAFYEYYISRNRMLCIKRNKEYFGWSAYIYSMWTRMIKALYYFIKRDKRYKSDIFAIIDAAREQYVRRF